MKPQLRTSRRLRYCSEDFAHARRIDAGDKYWVLTEFPSDDSGYAKHAGHPVRWAYCLQCGDRYRFPARAAEEGQP